MKHLRKLAVSAALLLALLASGSLAQAEGDEVAWTSKGERYHKTDCRYVRGRSGVTYGTTEAARARGLTPCKVCKPKE